MLSQSLSFINLVNQYTSFKRGILKLHQLPFLWQQQTCRELATFCKSLQQNLLSIQYNKRSIMHKNRLIQLTQISGRSHRVGSKIVLPPSLQVGNQQYTELQNTIEKMISNNEQLAELKKQFMKVVNPAKQKQINQRVSQAVQQNRSFMHQIEKGVKEMNDKQKKDFQSGNKANTIQVTRITQKASKALLDFKDKQQQFSNAVKGNIRRQANFIQGDNISEEQVEDIMANPEKGQQMLRAKLLDSPSVQLQNAVSDIIDKYNDIILLQKSMHECLQMMQQLALLVALTGEQLDNIQNTIVQAEDFTVNAEQKLIDAKKHHKSAKKKMCCIMMLLLATIGVVLIPILITKL